MAVEHLQPLDAPLLDMPGLLVMDVDSTLINEEVIDLLGEAAGVGKQVAEVTARAMAGQLDFAKALQERVALLAGLPESVFDQVRMAAHFTTGAYELIDTLHNHGWHVGIVSGGFHEVVDSLADEIGIDHRLANRLTVSNGVLTGAVDGPIVTRHSKRQALLDWARADGIPMTQTVALGDGANDIPMIREAQLGIAFCAKPAVREAAPYTIDTRDLSLVLNFLR